MKKLVHGVGVNDAGYSVKPRIKGGRSVCPFYGVWHGMLRRCYSDKFKERNPTYKGCLVCEEWLTFSNFKAWMEKQYWYMMELDKDLLFKGNKVYSPETCIFISNELNQFTVKGDASRGNYPIGVYFHKKAGKLVAQCKNPFEKSTEYLGLFDCPKEAHQAWRKRKHELACKWADIVEDERLKQALKTRYIEE